MFSALNAIEGSASQSLALGHSSLLTTSPFVDDDPPSPTNTGSETKNLKIGIVVHNRALDYPMRINTLQKFQEINKRVSHFLASSWFCLFRRTKS